MSCICWVWTVLQHHLKQNWQSRTNVHLLWGSELVLDSRDMEIKACYPFQNEYSPPAKDHRHLPQRCAKMLICVSPGLFGTLMAPRLCSTPICLSIKQGAYLHRNTSSPSVCPKGSPSLPRKGTYTKQHSINVDMHEEFQWRHFQLAALNQIKNTASPACFHLRDPSYSLLI